MTRVLTVFDPMVRLLVLAILLASVLPATGGQRDIAQAVSNGAIFLLFLLNGLRLSRDQVRRGIGHWQFLLPLAIWCFGAMTLMGKGFAIAMAPVLPPMVALGFLFLGALPSTVQSATAYTSLADGNVANSVVAAALLNVMGVFLTVPIFAAMGGGSAAELGMDGLVKIVAILVVPFAIGQVLQVRLAPWIGDHRALITWMDRLSIAIAVYVAFSAAVEQGLWARVGAAEWLVLLAGVVAMLGAAFGAAWAIGRMLALDIADRIAFLFAGAHKSLAMGAPLASVLFPPAAAGMILLPLLVYHLLQLMVSAPLASRLARRPRQAPDCCG
ncbi:bile acid:sodium symporter [Altererythrobacter aerius]|uniref:Bile acid:sodium symporter n=1 Tax=Tsuneonella aeria TaxID=1837929 RepID=A0A6I4T9H1_9SPHN|nr:bile acid:sodium symporter family protein [Tsuneonella aeria]MXO73971.1 bile acid:sodium symporter [Tsuneonella aeria]